MIQAPEIIVKHPESTRKVNFDLSESDELATGETLSSVSETEVTPAGELSVDNAAISGLLVQVTLAGGVAGKEYHVQLKIPTSLGQTLVVCGLVHAAEC